MTNSRCISVRQWAVSLAVLSLVGLDACAHNPRETSSVAQLWEVANRSQCAATVDVRTRHGRIMSLGTLPSGTTQTYRVATPAGAFVSALSVEEDGATQCRGTSQSQNLVTVRRLSSKG
jgi:hypothetical protein